jgi:hypothetical protein
MAVVAWHFLFGSSSKDNTPAPKQVADVHIPSSPSDCFQWQVSIPTPADCPTAARIAELNAKLDGPSSLRLITREYTSVEEARRHGHTCTAGCETWDEEDKVLARLAAEYEANANSPNVRKQLQYEADRKNANRLMRALGCETCEGPMAPKKPNQTERPPPRDTEELRDNLAQDRADLMAGKITVKEARSRLKEANKLLQQTRRRLRGL